MKKYRIGICGLASENNTFSPSRTTWDDFRVRRGKDMLSRYPFLRGAAFSACDDIEFCSALYAQALPGGMVATRTYQRLKDDLLGELRSLGPLDAVYLDLHGAMKAETSEDTELDLVRAVREVVGPDCRLAASMDLHGNVSDQLVREVSLFSAYRTAPHIDEVETREKVCRLLAESLRRNWQLKRAYVSIPVLLPGEKTSTQTDPGRSIYASLQQAEWQEGILDVSLWVGYVWADEARAHATAVVTGLEEDRVREVAEGVAQRYWDARHDFCFGVPAGPVDWCIQSALCDQERPVFISDSGDNPTAGGVGDLCVGARALLEDTAFRNGQSAAIYAAIWDAAAVEECFSAGMGQSVKLQVGGQSDPASGDGRLLLDGEVIQVTENDPIAGKQAVVQSGGVFVILTERRKPFHHLRDFHAVGLEPREAKVVMVKIGYLVPELEAMAQKAYLALTPGTVNQDICGLKYDRIQRPMFPFHGEMDWMPEAQVFG